MNTVYNDIPPVIRNKSEESENYQCEERTREHKWGLRMRHYLPLITCWGQMRVLAKNNFLSIILYTALVKPKPKYVGMLTQQGMTIRTARLPGAGNLLGRAGEDLSGLPDGQVAISFFIFFYWQYHIFQFKHQTSCHCGSFCFAVPQSQHQFPFTLSNWPTSVS